MLLHYLIRLLTIITSLLTVALLGVTWVLPTPSTASREPLPQSDLERQIELPDGFGINVYGLGIAGPRMMQFTANGDLLVSAPRYGRVYILNRDSNGNGAADGGGILISDLYRPHGIALWGNWLYIAEGNAVLRVAFDSKERRTTGQPEYVLRNIPDGGNHWSRSVAIGPDEKLYVSIGSSCNACIEEHPWRAAIIRSELDGSHPTVFASGLRNSVGMAWRPGTGEMYATENGRDWLGDDFPPCELNRIVEAGFYGWPFVNGDGRPDPDFGQGRTRELAASTPPAFAFGAHVAPLGLSFYSAGQFPPRYHGAAFVALHGSWNRSTKSGYEVVALMFQRDGSIRQESFAKGFAAGDHVYGRPVDVAVGPDGALYVSDDLTGSVYRITYHGRDGDGRQGHKP